MENLSDITVSIQLNNSASKSVRKGHPWVYENSILKQNKEAPAGAVAVLYDAKRNFAGIGLYDPHSPIKVRVLHSGRQIGLNKKWLKEKLNKVFDLRKNIIFSDVTDGFRLCHGENDGLGGLVIDKYADTFVIKLDTPAWVNLLELIYDVLKDRFQIQRIIVRLSRSVKELPELPEHIYDGSVVFGDEPEGAVVFKENDIFFEADPVYGQKTGFFLDQRENRKEVGKLCEDKKVLNVFSYNGGFSLYAAKGGAKSVTSLDISAPAIEASERNFQLNSQDSNIRKCRHIKICGDAFKEMDLLAKQKKKYDVVIVDPPSFARKQSDVKGALSAYEKLAVLAAKLVEKNGYLISCSCSARVTKEDFYSAVFKGVSKSGRKFDEIKRTNHASDHPIGFTEGAYLKSIYLKIK